MKFHQERITPVYDRDLAAEVAWQALIDAECFREGEYSFAFNEESATLKVDADHLKKSPSAYARVIGLLASHPLIERAEVLLYVPEGHREAAQDVAAITGKPLAHAHRVKGGGRHDFLFDSPEDEELARAYSHALILDDVSTTGSSPAAIRRMMSESQDVYALSILMRGLVRPEYFNNYGFPLGYDALVWRTIPLDANEFRDKFDIEPIKDL